MVIMTMMEWFCGDCCRQRIERQRYQQALTEELLAIIQFKPPNLDAVRPRVEACPEAVKVRDLFDNLPIHTACSNGASYQVIRCLVEAWPGSLKTVGSEQDTPLSLACIVSADLDILQYLGNKWNGAFLVPNKRHKRPLHVICARTPSLAVVQYMVDAAPQVLTTRDKSRDLPLHVACSHKASLEVVQLLVQANPATVRSRNMRRDLPLHMACGTRAGLPVIQLLVQAGPGTLTAVNSRGDTPLHIACAMAGSHHPAMQNERVVTYLMDKCPEVLEQANHAKLADQQLPIHMACAGRAGPLILQQLVERAVHTLGVKDAKGNLPLHVACRENAPLTSIRIILDALPDTIRNTNDQGNLPLHQACCATSLGVSLELIQFLVETWDTVWQRHQQSTTPRNNSDDDMEEQRQLLLEQDRYVQGATVMNRDGDTPLHLACHGNAAPEVIYYLTELWPGALLVRNAAGQTPIQRAQVPRRGIPTIESIRYMTSQLSKRLFKVCSLQDPNLQHLQEILEAHPSVVEQVNKEGDLPIHALLSNESKTDGGPCVEAVRLLVQAWPQSLLRTNASTGGDAPLHLACRNLQAASHSYHDVARQIVVLIIQENSMTVRERHRTTGEIALHVALHGGHATADVVRALVAAWPESVLVKNRDGNMPWQILAQARVHNDNEALVRWLQDRTEAVMPARVRLD